MSDVVPGGRGSCRSKRSRLVTVTPPSWAFAVPIISPAASPITIHGAAPLLERIGRILSSGEVSHTALDTGGRASRFFSSQRSCGDRFRQTQRPADRRSSGRSAGRSPVDELDPEFDLWNPAEHADHALARNVSQNG